MNCNYKKFLVLWIGEFVSSVGTGLTAFGLGVYVFNTTGSAAQMSLITLIGFLPSFILSIPAGVLADKYDRRLLMVIGDGFSAIGIVFLLICMLGGGATILQICFGMGFSSVFSALLEPAYKATITDLLSKEQFSKANGLVSLSASSRYLFSPIIAGFILAVSDIKIILIIDICTFFFTVISTVVVKKSIKNESRDTDTAFFKDLRDGWNEIKGNKGVFALLIFSAIITMFMGIFQTLARPFVLSLTDSKTLGIAETICACGMVVSGIVIGVRGIKKNYVKVLSVSLTLSGLFMAGFCAFNNIALIVTFGFLFFTALPFANNCLDFLTRTNIQVEFQGRAWGLIGFVSQLGYVFAYGFSGTIADRLGELIGGVGRGAALVIIISGIFLMIIAVIIPAFKELNDLEKQIDTVCDEE